MMGARFFRPARLLKAGLFSAALAGAVLAGPGQAAEAVRPEVGKPLQAAQDLLKAKRYKDALAKIRDADAAANKTANETYLIERTRAAAASSAGDTATAIKAFEAVMASGKTPPGEQAKMAQALAGLHYQAKSYGEAAKWAARYYKEGGTDPQMRTIQAQAYYLSGDCKSVAASADGSQPPESLLQMLASCYANQKDNNGYAAALEKLVLHYPKKEYWVDVINRVQRKSGFADRLALDVYRLKLATGNLASEGDYMESAQLALQEGYAAEARKIIDQGFAAKVLGTGKDAARHKRLSDLATQRLAEAQKAAAQKETEAGAEKDGTALANLGFDAVAAGQAAKGLALMEKGLAKGALKRPEDVRLHLGVAYALAGQKAKAIQTLKAVKGTDGTADLARLWVIHLQQGA
jgi:hypothetical protein